MATDKAEDRLAEAISEKPKEIDPYDVSGKDLSEEMIKAKYIEYAKIRKWHLTTQDMAGRAPSPVYDVFRMWFWAIPFTLGIYYISLQGIKYFRAKKLEEIKDRMQTIEDLGGTFSLNKNSELTKHWSGGAAVKSLVKEDELDEDDYAEMDKILKTTNKYRALLDHNMSEEEKRILLGIEPVVTKV